MIVEGCGRRRQGFTGVPDLKVGQVTAGPGLLPDNGDRTTVDCVLDEIRAVREEISQKNHD